MGDSGLIKDLFFQDSHKHKPSSHLSPSQDRGCLVPTSRGEAAAAEFGRDRGPAETHFLAWGPRGRASSETGEAKWSGSPFEARSLTAASLHHLQQQGSSGQCAPRAGTWAHPNTPFPARRGAPSPRQAANQLSGLGEPRCISQPALLLLRGNFPAIPSICAATSHPLPSHSKLPSSSSPWVRLCGSDPTAAHTHLLLPHFLFSGERIMCWCKSSSAWLRSSSRRGAELSGQRRRDLPC